MANWAVGDIQGCGDELAALVANVTVRDPAARFWFCGDLINRGPKNRFSLSIIQTLQLQNKAVVVLGNHDLFALACYAGFVTPKAGDTLGELLQGDTAWVNWLRGQKLAHYENGFLLTHAGVFPAWQVSDCLQQAAAIETLLRSDDWAAKLKTIWQPSAQDWAANADALNQTRFAVNALLRMRFINAEGGLDLSLKEGADAALPAGFKPWFAAQPKAAREAVLVFGHWSALGLHNTSQIIGLDTGCVWGGALTAMRLEADIEKRDIVQIQRFT